MRRTPEEYIAGRRERTPEEWYKLGLEGAKEVTPAEFRDNVDYPDIWDIERCYNYLWWAGLVKKHPFKQIVELGGAMGVWSLMVASTAPKETNIWTITLPEHGLEYSFVKKEFPNLHMVVGDDLKWESWPKDFDITKTDAIYFDALHTYEQLSAELKMYGPKLKSGTLAVFDDISLNEEMKQAWAELDWPKFDQTGNLHWSGYGIAVKP